jgi:hypothetical protein
MAKTALIVIDKINTYDHDDVDLLLPSVKAVRKASTTWCCADRSPSSACFTPHSTPTSGN